MPLSKLLEIYVPLMSWTGLGWVLGRWLPASVPRYLGLFLFWVGVPIGIVAFLRHTQLTKALWLAPVAAWGAMLLSYGLARLYLKVANHSLRPATQTSFQLASMVGNTGYIGFPVSLVLVGSPYFAWAVFYDMVGSTPGAYGLGVALAARTQAAAGHDAPSSTPNNWQVLGTAMLLNPALWSFTIGILARDLPLPGWLEVGLRGTAWGVVAIALVLIGIRLSQVTSLKHVRLALMSLTIKMLIVPLLLGMILRALNLSHEIHRVILLQSAMPPAFATLVIAEAYELDQALTVTTIAIGVVMLLLTLPLWLWVFP